LDHDVGRRLAAARLQRGLVQSTVARDAGLAPSYLSRIETGKVQPTFPTVMQVVRALGADAAEIVDPGAKLGKRRGPCPVTAKGRCLLDLIKPVAGDEQYTPRELRLLRQFALWIKGAEPGRVRAMEILLEDLLGARRE
jgi:transcriptional regulator with XRE-family HTH domain